MSAHPDALLVWPPHDDFDLLSELLLQDEALSDASVKLTAIAPAGVHSTKATSHTSVGAQHRVELAINARRRRARKKTELLDLRQQVEDLSTQLDGLRAQHHLTKSHGVPGWEELVIVNSRKRRQAELENELLRKALYIQGSILSGLKHSLFQAPSSLADLNMRQLLHMYTQLSSAPSTRRRDLIEACCEDKLDLAISVLLRETEGVDFVTPSIIARQIQLHKANEFGVTTTSTYSFDTLDVMKIFLGACAAIYESGLEWPQYVPLDSEFEVLETPKDNIRYGLSRVRHAHEQTGEQVVLETRPITYFRVTATYSILLWDFVDVDDKFPLGQATRIKRDASGALLIRREICVDDVERVVVRSVCTNIHSLSGERPDKTSETERFSKSTGPGACMCGAGVYNHIKDGYFQNAVANV